MHEAARLFRLSADQGNAFGMNNLGILYRDGDGVPRDLAEAKSWFKRAAAAGNADAKKNLRALNGGGGTRVSQGDYDGGNSYVPAINPFRVNPNRQYLLNKLGAPGNTCSRAGGGPGEGGC